jgi:hypothetical protein
MVCEALQIKAFTGLPAKSADREIPCKSTTCNRYRFCSNTGLQAAAVSRRNTTFVHKSRVVVIFPGHLAQNARRYAARMLRE